MRLICLRGSRFVKAHSRQTTLNTIQPCKGGEMRLAGVTELLDEFLEVFRLEIIYPVCYDSHNV